MACSQAECGNELASADHGGNPPVGRQAVVTALLLVLAAILPYLNTFNVPFYFDDINNIVDNPLIRDLPLATRGLLEHRGFAMFTFALNYRLGGMETTGFHVVNLAVHVGCVLLVWQLLVKLVTGPRVWAFCGALLFALHPLQTQAVTYVVQRMSSLAALLFVAAVCGYLAALDATGRRRWGFYGGSLLCGALAVLCKENTVVLPLLLLLVERQFRPGRSWRAQLAGVLPFCLAPVWKAVEMLLLPIWRGDVAATVHYADQLQNMQNVTPLRYLFTEFSVIWYYFKLLLLPVGLRLDYGWPVVDRLLTAQNLVALLGLVALWAVAWWLRRRRPLVSFGIAWFFLTLAVESSIIPLDPIFEHRLYLPMFGFVLVAIDLLRALPRPRLQVAVVVVILPLLALLTWQRNALWNDPVAFFESNQRHHPDNVRILVMLGNAYVAGKRYDEGLRTLEQALKRNPSYDFAYIAMGKFLIDQGRSLQAMPVLQRGVQIHPTSIVLNEYLAIAYGEAGDLPQSLRYFERALSLDPDDATVITNIGVLYSRVGDNRNAVEYFERSLRLVPDSEKTLVNLSSARYALGDNRRAFEALREVVRVNPDNADAQYGRGTLALEFGARQEAFEARDALRRLGDERAPDLDRLLGR